MNTERPTLDETMIQVAKVLSLRSTCVRRQVGCVLTNVHGHVIGSGYNGVAKHQKHCTLQNPCVGATYSSGEGLHLCEAIHAEQNALLQCSNTQTIHTVYTTTFPCIHCMKLITNTSAKRIVYMQDYDTLGIAKCLASKTGILCIQI